MPPLPGFAEGGLWLVVLIFSVVSMLAIDLLVFSCFANIMARTTVSNAEFLARAKTRRREEDAAEEVAPL